MIENNAADSSRERPRLSEGLIIAAIPGIGYLLAFVYQLGYATQMHLPIALIRLELRDVLLATVVLVFALLTFFGVANALMTFLRFPTHPAKRSVVLLGIIVAAFMLPQIVIYRRHLDRVALLLLLASVLLVPLLVPPIRFPRNTEGYWERVQAWGKWSPSWLKLQPPITTIVERRYGYWPLIIAGLVLLIYLDAYSFGRASALDQRDFLTLPQTSEVVIAIYGRSAVLAPYTGARFKNSFRVIDLDDSPNTKMELHRIGPLRPESIQ